MTLNAKAVLTLAKVSMIMPGTRESDSHYCTCLGLLGQRDTNRNNPISVELPKVANASSSVLLLLALSPM